MIIDTVNRNLRRLEVLAVDDIDFTDITQAERDGPAVWVEGGLSIPFATEPTDEEQRRIVIRLTTATQAEETIVLAAHDALASNAQWVAEVVPQLLAGADQVANSATSSSFDKGLANGIRTLTNRVEAHSKQINALIRLALREFNEDE